MQTESKPQAQRTGACWGLARSRTRLSDPWPGLREGRRRGPAGGQGRLWPGPATRRWRQELPAEPRASSYFPRKKCLQTTPPPRGQGAPAHDSSLCCRHRIASQTARLRARPGSVPSPGEASPSGDPLPAETPAPRPGTGGPASTGNVLRDAALTGEVGRVSGDGICLGPRSPRGVPRGDLEGAPMRGASWP